MTFQRLRKNYQNEKSRIGFWVFIVCNTLYCIKMAFAPKSMFIHKNSYAHNSFSKDSKALCKQCLVKVGLVHMYVYAMALKSLSFISKSTAKYNTNQRKFSFYMFVTGIYCHNEISIHIVLLRMSFRKEVMEIVRISDIGICSQVLGMVRCVVMFNIIRGWCPTC